MTKRLCVSCLPATDGLLGQSMLLLAAALLALSSTTHAQQALAKSTIVIGTELDYPPYSFMGDDGQPTGFNVELTQAIAEVMGLDLEIRIGPWAEIRDALETGRIDAIVGMYYSSERDKLVDFSSAFTIVDHAVFARSDSPKVITEEDLRGKEIIVMRGGIMHDYILEYILEKHLPQNPFVVDTQAEALRLLASGKHDYALVCKLPGLYWVKKLNLSNVETVGPLMRPSQYCFAVSEGNMALAARFTKGLAIIKHTNKYKQIHDKWLEPLEPRGITTDVIVRYAVLILVPLCALIIITAVWSQVLRRQVAQRTAQLRKEIAEHEQADQEIERLSRFPSEDRGPVLRVSREGLLLYANPASEKLLRDWSCQVEEPVPEYWKKVSQDALEKNAEQIIEYNLADRTLSFVIAPVAGAGYVNLHGRDITDRKRGEAILQKSEERFRLLYERSPLGYQSLDADGNLIEVNQAWLSLLGYEKEEVIGRLFADFLATGFGELFNERFPCFKAAGEARSVPFEMVRKDGIHIHVEIDGKISYNPDGSFKQTHCVLRDVTERRKAEEEMLNLSRFPSEDRSPVLRVSQEGVLLYANPASDELLRDWGCQVEEPVPEYWKKVSQDALKKKAEQRIECDLANRTLSFVIAPVAGSGYVNLYGRDITDRKKAEEESFNAQQRLIDQRRHETEHVETELARVRQELVRSTRLAAIGQVSASIAHDLRNPLGTVRNAAYLLNRHLPKDEPKLLDYIDIIDQEVAKADQIITNLLEMVGAKVPRKRPVDLGQIIEEVEQARKSEGVACRISVAPDPFVVQADEDQLRQVIDNILSNSVYAMGGQGSFFVEASRDSDYDTIVFRDTGSGFAPEVRDRLFEALVTTKASGIGLGLTICHQIIEKHGGTIEADEHNQQGAIIRIRLPRG